MSSVIEQIHACKKNGWDDLLITADNLLKSLMTNPEAGRQIVKGLQKWNEQVLQRTSLLTPNEEDLTEKNPVMSFDESFGAEI